MSFHARNSAFRLRGIWQTTPSTRSWRGFVPNLFRRAQGYLPHERQLSIKHGLVERPVARKARYTLPTKSITSPRRFPREPRPGEGHRGVWVLRRKHLVLIGGRT